MDKKIINYFDLGAHFGLEIILFLWHINYLRKNGFLKDCVVNIHAFEPSPIQNLLKRRIRGFQVFTLKERKDWDMKTVDTPCDVLTAKHLNAYEEQFDVKNTHLIETDVNNISIHTVALTNVEGMFNLFLSKRYEHYEELYPNNPFFDKMDVQPHDYIGSTLFSSKKTGGIKKDNFIEVKGVLFSKWIKKNIDDFKDSINIVKLNIEGSESMVIGDLVEADMLKYFQIICGYDLLADVRKIPELEKTNKEFEKMLEDNNVPSRFIHFCADNEDNLLKDFGLMSERIADELVKKGWEKYE